MLLVSVLGFTLVSALCGLATSLGELVAFRALQGMCGASLVPMSQAILLDINPPERHGQAMATFGMGSMLAPIMGPVLGGWLTEDFSWRWVFYVNVPVGLLTFLGIAVFLRERPITSRIKLDVTGFLMLALAIGSLQLVLDRGQQQDWYASTEIWAESALSVFFFYTFVVQTMTARHPFIDFALFKDRNFLVALLYGFLFGVLLFSVLALLPTMMQTLLGYPVLLTGLVSAPRGIGTFVSTMIVGSLIRRLDPRVLIFSGFLLVAGSLYVMSGFSLQMDQRLIILSGIAAGVGNGMIFVPLATVAFATLNTRLTQRGHGDVHADQEPGLCRGNLGAADDDIAQCGHRAFPAGGDDPAGQSGACLARTGVRFPRAAGRGCDGCADLAAGKHGGLSGRLLDPVPHDRGHRTNGGVHAAI